MTSKQRAYLKSLAMTMDDIFQIGKSSVTPELTTAVSEALASRGKWKSRIICVLAEKKLLRYSDLRREMANITDAVLATTLKELIADEIIHRKQFDEIPPRVEYCLTDKGISVVPILRSICQWAGIYRNEDSELSLPQCKKCNYLGGNHN